MSAVPSELRLFLAGDESLPRELVVVLSRLGNLSAMIYAPGGNTMIAYMRGRLAECRLDHDCLWLAGAAFDVTKEEAAAIDHALAPLGLHSHARGA